MAPCFAASSDTGTTAGSFLKILDGSRPAALGDAFLAVADDNNGIYWNPAGLTQINLPALSSMYGSWLTGISFANLSYIIPMERFTYGLSFSYVSYGDIAETTLGQPGGTGRSFNPTDYVLYSSLAYKLTPSVSLGLNAKYLTGSIDNNSASGLGADAGLFWACNKEFSLGAAARNFLGKVGNDLLPSNYGIGAAYKLPSITIAADLNLPNDNKLMLNLGIEYRFKDILAGRIGYNTRAEEAAGGNLGLGLGLNFSSFGLDYAYVPYGDLGVTHRLSFSYYPEKVYLPVPTSLTIDPPKAVLTAGDQLTVKTGIYDQHLTRLALSPQWTITNDIGTWDAASRTFYAAKAGTGEITARYKNLIAASLITVKPGRLKEIRTNVEKIRLKRNKKMTIYVRGVDERGNDCGLPYNFKLTMKIAEITKQGVLTARHAGTASLIINFESLAKIIPVEIVK